MRQRPYLFAVALTLVVVGLSVLADRRTRAQHVFTGTVREWKAGESLIIASQQTNPRGFTVRLRDTHYEGRADQIAAGSSVTVWYRQVGESHPVADKVRVNAQP